MWGRIFALVFLFHAVAGKSVGSPNIIFILTDDLGLGDTSVNEFRSQPSNSSYQIETPNLERLAKSAVIFQKTYSSTVCAPSRFSLLFGVSTGRSPVRGNPGNEVDFEFPKDLANTGYPRKLAEARYKTLLVGKWGFKTSPKDSGFDMFYGLLSHRENHSCFPAHVYMNDTKETLSLNTGEEMDKASLDQENVCTLKSLEQKENCTFFHKLITNKAIEWIKESASGSPFFLQISYTAPHFCSVSSNMEKRRRLASIAPYTDFQSCQFVKNQPPQNLEMNECRYRSLIKEYLDRDVGRILDLVESLQIRENTVIIFASDNGPDELNNVHSFKTFDSTAGLEGKKRKLFEGGIRVPLLISWPRFTNSTRIVTERVRLLDLYATFVDLAMEGWAKNKTISFEDSQSLAPTLTNPSVKPAFNRYILELYCPKQAINWESIDKKPERFCSRALIKNDMKFIFDHVSEKKMVFNLTNDPGEKIDLSRKVKFECDLKSLSELKLFRSLKKSGYWWKDGRRNRHLEEKRSSPRKF